MVGRAASESFRLAGRARVVGPPGQRAGPAGGGRAVHRCGHARRPAPGAGRGARGGPLHRRPNADPPGDAADRGRSHHPRAGAGHRAHRRRDHAGAPVGPVRGRRNATGRGRRPGPVRRPRGCAGPRDDRRRALAGAWRHARRGRRVRAGRGDPQRRSRRPHPTRGTPGRQTGGGRGDGHLARRPRGSLLAGRPAAPCRERAGWFVQARRAAPGRGGGSRGSPGRRSPGGRPVARHRGPRRLPAGEPGRDRGVPAGAAGAGERGAARVEPGHGCHEAGRDRRLGRPLGPRRPVGHPAVAGPVRRARGLLGDPGRSPARGPASARDRPAAGTWRRVRTPGPHGDGRGPADRGSRRPCGAVDRVPPGHGGRSEPGAGGRWAWRRPCPHRRRSRSRRWPGCSPSWRWCCRRSRPASAWPGSGPRSDDRSGGPCRNGSGSILRWCSSPPWRCSSCASTVLRSRATPGVRSGWTHCWSRRPRSDCWPGR